ncbi:MAG TPA: ABC transporter permease [Vicinamibacterales bacterium]
MLRELYARLRAAARWKRNESDLDDEIQFHLSEEVDEQVEAGLTPKEARFAAARDFGNVTLVREAARDVWGWAFVERLVQDVRYTFRTMRRHPAFSLAVILSLALGIGANAAVFSLMNAVMLRSLPVVEPERLAIFAHQGAGDPQTGSNYPIYETLSREGRSFAGVLGFWQMPMKLRVGGATFSLDGQYVTPNYFSVLGVRPALGRMLSDADAASDVAVISDTLWTQRFGAAPDVIGRAVVVNGVPVTVVGVHPPEFFGLRPGSSIDISVPLALQRRMAPEFGDRLALREGTWGLCIVARLRDGVSREAAGVEAEALIRPWVKEVGMAQSSRFGSWARIGLLDARSGLDTLRRQFSRPLWLLMAVVVMVLVIACANIANLLLARSASRRREIALRASIGAGRSRLVRQLFTESFVLAAIGGLAGLLLATWAARLLVVFLSGGTRLVLDVDPDVRVLSFAAAITFGTAIVCGLAPAFRATKLELNASLKEHAATVASDVRGGRLRRLLVAGQVAVSLLVLIVASLFLRSLTNIRAVDPGFDGDRLFVVSFDRFGTGYRGERLTAFYKQSLERIAAIPGVQAASLSSVTPVSGDESTRAFNTPGYTGSAPDDHVVRINAVSPRYFETMRIPVAEGRAFSDRDDAKSPNVAIVSRSTARHYFGERSAIGATFRLGRDAVGPPIEIVGVVGDTRQADLREAPVRMVYFPLEQVQQSDIVIEVRAAGRMVGVVDSIRGAVAAVSSDVPIESIKTIAERVDDVLVQERLVAILSSLFGLLALLLASLGLYGVVNYAVTLRTGEIGIRMALGADRSSVARMILRDAGLVVAVGLLLGVIAALALARTLADMLFGLEPVDAGAYLIATATLLVVAAIAAFIPARRASMIDPVLALRDQ